MSFSSRARDGRVRPARRNVEPLEVIVAEPLEDDDDAVAKPASARGWYASSLELRHGLEVSDVPLDTLPDDLISGFTKW